MADDDLDYQDDDFAEEEQDEAVDGDADSESSSTPALSKAERESAEEIIAAAATAQSSLKARNKMRDAMSADIEAFLAKGGKIQQIDDNVMADPPKKPSSNYGSQPI